MDRTVTIGKAVNLGLLTRELKMLAAGCTGCSLNGGTTLTVHGADALTDQQILDAVVTHVMPVPECADEMRQGVGTIFAGSAAQRRARMVDVTEKYPPLGIALAMLRGTLTPDARGFIVETMTRVRAKIGTGATEILTATEYQALKALATAKGLGALVP